MNQAWIPDSASKAKHQTLPNSSLLFSFFFSFSSPYIFTHQCLCFHLFISFLLITSATAASTVHHMQDASTEKYKLQTRTEAARRIFAVRRQEEEEEEFEVEVEERMDLSGTQGELPIPMHAAAVASPYAAAAIGGSGGHVMELHHHNEHVSNNGGGHAQSHALQSPAAAAAGESSPVAKKRGLLVAAGTGGGGGGAGAGAAAVKYRECLKNHAAAIGGNATDGCGEFMPSGEEGSLEALKCSACGCHRNFHRKDVDDFDGDSCATHAHGHGLGYGGALRAGGSRHLLGPAVPPHHHKNGGGGLLVATDPYGAAYAAARALPPPPPPHGHHHQIIMPLNMIHTSESDEMDGSGGAMAARGASGGGGGGGSSSSSKKRFRTKFTAEQKARMLDFAERVGWRLQKLDDAMVQHFCQEIGVKRRVLKVWMHNNKHNLAKKPLPTSPPPMIPMAMPPSPPMPMPPSQQPEPSTSPQLKLE
ncbi:zinc-finger homeodomain protein 4-like isoform X1 [Oryza brachyantha]|uniref:zinc-finger homeodomain protein 4-like isoform X1 n=2 Tax=Oryza brachyantha TaxID=4533 RepID=UPI001ADB7DC6|nr:zinc-finger homeodomain protein 4-like isoform X1 [Oryza brachyantha]